jgi:hypothetical protein
MNMLGLCRTYSMLLKILPFAIYSYVSSLSVQALQSRSCISYLPLLSESRVTLRLLVYRQSVHLDAKPLETHDQRCISSFFFNLTLAAIILVQHPL